MFNTINKNTINKPPTNEYDVKLAEIELEKIKEISKHLPEYSKLCGKYLIPTDGDITISMCGTEVQFRRSLY